MSYEIERQTAIEAARMAGRACLQVRTEMLGQSADVKAEKVGREPVTVADYASQAIILHHIAKQFPDDGAVAEEHAADLDSLMDDTNQQRIIDQLAQASGDAVTLESVQTALDWGRSNTGSRQWVVDPIDGTKGFIRGDQFAVAIALLVDGVIQVGVLACPMMDEGDEQGFLLAAVRGEGTQATSLNGTDWRTVTVTPEDQSDWARLVESVETRHTDHSFSGAIIERAGLNPDSVRIDSQAKYAAVADARAEVYIRNSKDHIEKIWDHAAGVIVVEEAGGRVTDLDGKPLDFSLGQRLSGNRGVLATNTSVHEDILEAIRWHEGG